MEQDYIEILLDWLSEHRLDAMDGEYFLQEKQERAAARALEATLTGEQRKLYLAYEAERSHMASLDVDAAARQAFLLARDIFR